MSKKAQLFFPFLKYTAICVEKLENFDKSPFLAKKKKLFVKLWPLFF